MTCVTFWEFIAEVQWTLFAIVFIAVFGRRIGALLGRLTEFEGPAGIKGKFEAPQSLAAAASAATGSRSTAGPSGATGPGSDSWPRGPIDEEQRALVDQVMKEAFGWGWQNAQLFPGHEIPDLEVRWRPGGQPPLIFWKS